MVSVADTAKRILDEQGHTQTWAIEQMNLINPRLEMDNNKMSTTLLGKRKMTGDELLAFCMALKISPDEFLKQE